MPKCLFAIIVLLGIMSGCKEVARFEDPNRLSEIPYSPTSQPVDFPKGLPRLELPAENPTTVEGVHLGRKLFFDPILSADSSMSCVSCHLPELAFTDGNAVSKGIDQKAGRRSAMSLVNVAFYYDGLFWDGRSKTLEEQALIPVEDSIELHNTWDVVVAKLQTHPSYPVLFRKAFGIQDKMEIDKYLVAKAIAQYERSLISINSKFDRFNRGEVKLTPDELAGFQIFFDENTDLPDAECGHCHNQPLMTTNEFLNNGIQGAATEDDFLDAGFGLTSGYAPDNGKFRIPTLRNIELTAPYMHDGRFKTLEEVIDHYNSGGQDGPNVSPLIGPLNLTETHKRQLIAFLKTLTDTTFVNKY